MFGSVIPKKLWILKTGISKIFVCLVPGDPNLSFTGGTGGGRWVLWDGWCTVGLYGAVSPGVWDGSIPWACDAPGDFNPWGCDVPGGFIPRGRDIPGGLVLSDNICPEVWGDVPSDNIYPVVLNDAASDNICPEVWRDVPSDNICPEVWNDVPSDNIIPVIWHDPPSGSVVSYPTAGHPIAQVVLNSRRVMFRMTLFPCGLILFGYFGDDQDQISTGVDTELCAPIIHLYGTNSEIVNDLMGILLAAGTFFF